ncbi:MAG: hypothetical protein VX589_11795, partial [Myxococcota bacterium]|nr:hypothetical protein [Myxococcota bacterium]
MPNPGAHALDHSERGSLDFAEYFGPHTSDGLNIPGHHHDEFKCRRSISRDYFEHVIFFAWGQNAI